MKRKVVYWAPWFEPQEVHHWNILFLEPQKIIEMISQESWEQLKIDTGDKKIFFVKKSNRMFIVKI